MCEQRVLSGALVANVHSQCSWSIAVLQVCLLVSPVADRVAQYSMPNTDIRLFTITVNNWLLLGLVNLVTALEDLIDY